MNKDLWSRISEFQIDREGSQLKFSDRLARDNGWSPEYTQEAILEYKRFLYLCLETGHQVTPSEVVDEVWHLHLCYTRSYWNDLCRDLLNKPIHHEPTQGGIEERSKYQNLYQKTLDSYQREFGSAPPETIWPRAEDRFAIQKQSKKISWQRRSVAVLLVALVCSFGLVGCSQLLVGQLDFDSLGIFAVFVMILIVIVSVKSFFSKGGGGGKRGGSDSGNGGCGCDHDGDSHCSSDHDSGCSSGCGGGCGGD